MIKRKLDFDDVLIVPKPSEISSRADVCLDVQYVCKHSKRNIIGVPVIVANMDTVATISMAKALSNHKLFVSLHKHIEEKDLISFFRTEESQYSFYTTGISSEDLDKLSRVSKECNITKITIDVANGYMYSFLNIIKQIRDKFPNAVIMAGNVCTPEGVENIIKAGADIVKAGIAQGGQCMTKHKAAIGYKQFSVALECGQAANELNALCCSDGGCKTPADICKALGAGSHFVMCGTMFGGYDECGGQWVVENNEKFMIMYGMSSEEANIKYNGGLKDYRTSEGRISKIPYKGSIVTLIQDIKGSLASCCAYTNTKNLENLYKNCEFTR